MPAPLVILGLTAAAITVSVVAASGAKKYRPPNPAALGLLFGPSGEDVDPDPATAQAPDQAKPQRIAVPPLKWHELAGQLRIDSMAEQPRFPAAEPGYVTVELATLTHSQKGLRLLCDVLVRDATLPLKPPQSAAAAVFVRHATYAPDKSVRGPSQWSERLVRRFAAEPIPHQPNKLTAATSLSSAPLPVVELITPNPPLYMGKGCKGYDEGGFSEIDKLFPIISAAFRGGDTDPPEGKQVHLFDEETCGYTGQRAYDDAQAFDGSGSFPRIYGLSLVPKADAVVLVGKFARLPLPQVLDWRAWWTVTPGGGG